MRNWLDSVKELHTGDSFDFSPNIACRQALSSLFAGLGCYLKLSDSFVSLSCDHMGSFADLKKSRVPGWLSVGLLISGS